MTQLVSVEHIQIAEHSLPVMTISLINKTIISIPTQIGCPVKCQFCVSSESPFVRNLTANEMIQLTDSALANKENILLSFTGEGEPLLNLDNVNKVMQHYDTNNQIKEYRICTSGAAINKLANIQSNKPLLLQFSLHSARQEVRSVLIPLSKSLDAIKGVLGTTKHLFSEISVNYVLMKDVNDSDEDLYSLVNYADPTWLIKLNPLLDETQFQKSQRHNHFYDILTQTGFRTKIFNTIGSTIKNDFYSGLTYNNNMIAGCKNGR